MSILLILAVRADPANPSDVLSAWDQFTTALTSYKIVGLSGLLALGIAVVVSVIKRWGDDGDGPNWWQRLPRLARTMIVASFGALAGVIAAVHGGANPGQAVVVGASGLLSILGHELAKRYGLAGPSGGSPAEAAPPASAPPPSSTPTPPQA